VQVLRAAVAERERERNCKRPADTLIACSAIWTKLVSGRWSLIDDYEDGGRRYILAVRNDAYANEFMLSAAEARTIELSVLGRSPKQMVDELGVSISRVYALRHSALRKLSARSIADVIALARQRPATFFGRIPLGQDALIALRGPAVEQDLSVLSAAEREVGRDLLRAVPQRDIARRRGRALRTVANQVRSIYRKLGVSDRNEFVTLVRAGTRPRRH
jgi:DNA-binding CsgD family transcriptional regulator